MFYSALFLPQQHFRWSVFRLCFQTKSAFLYLMMYYNVAKSKRCGIFATFCYFCSPTCAKSTCKQIPTVDKEHIVFVPFSDLKSTFLPVNKDHMPSKTTFWVLLLSCL